MARIFEIEWPDFDVAVCAELLDEENPELCDTFWQGLPCKTIFAASMSAGHLFKVPIPFLLPFIPLEKRLPIVQEASGTIFAFSNNELMVKYGTVVEPFVVARLARISDSELAKLKEVTVQLSDAYFFSKEINMATMKRKE